MPVQLFPHQVKALEETKEFNRVGYFLDMGLGKTFVGSEKCISLKGQYTLIVCQKSKLQDWFNHFNELYRCDQPGLDDVYSDYSKIISFGTDDINQGGSQGTDATPGPNDPSSPKKKECWFCHCCPQPLGLCIFIWLLIILIVVIVIVIIVVSRKKKKAKTNNKQQ